MSKEKKDVPKPSTPPPTGTRNVIDGKMNENSLPTYQMPPPPPPPKEKK